MVIWRNISIKQLKMKWKRYIFIEQCVIEKSFTCIILKSSLWKVPVPEKAVKYGTTYFWSQIILQHSSNWECNVITYLQTYKSLWLVLLMAELTYHTSACCQKCVIHRAILQFLLLNTENCPMTRICEFLFIHLETF